MLSPVEICEQLTVDEFIELCQAVKPLGRFDIQRVRRRYGMVIVTASCDAIKEFEVDLLAA
jgi:hypothetical protein